MKALVISVLATGVIVAVLAPHEDVVAPDKPAQVAQVPAAQLATATTSQWSSGEMGLKRQDDGHFYATVKVDARDYRMLVDTGATVVALTSDDARDMGLDWDPNALAPVARGAGGPVMGVQVTIPSMAVGDFEARDVPALIIPDGLAVSLLGQSFLSHIPKVDIAGDTLTLSD